MKKLFTSCLFAGLAGILSASAIEVGDQFKIGDFTYVVKSENTVGFYKAPYATTEANLTETVSYDGVDYTLVSIERDAFYWTKITSIALPSTVTTLEYGAFRSCSNLTSVTMSPNLKTIGDYAFSSTAISKIDIPEGVESIGASCFFTCNSLTDVKLPSTLKSIGASCFYKVPFTSIALPASLETIGRAAFSTCTKLASITIPEGLKEIGEGMFYSCTALTTIDLPSSIESIGDEAFLSSGLTGTITLPASLTSIGGGAFGMTSVSEFNLASGSKFQKVDQCIYNSDKSLLLLYPPKSANTVVSVDKACRGTAYGAFWGGNVTKVTIPDGFRAFDEYSFVKSSLADINLPSSVVFIGEQAFAGTLLTEVTLPENLPQLQDAAFAQSTSLKTVNIPSSLEYIDMRAFSGCTALSTVNAYGMTPPELEDIYETYEGQFYNISSSAVLNLRPGCTSAYSKAGWNSYFKTVSESLPAVISPTEMSPAAESSVSTMTGVDLTFGEAVTVVKSAPAVTLRQGPLTLGTPTGAAVSVTGWMATASGTTAKIFACDDDGYTETMKLENGKEYYLTIPAGVFKNAAGELNARMFIHYTGSYTEPTFQPTSVVPASDTELAQLENIVLNFDATATKVGSTFQGTKIYKGSLVDGKVVGTEVTGYDQWYANVSGSKVTMFPGDEYDGFTMPVKFDKGNEYYVVIPAKSFRNSSSVYNNEIILHYTGSYTEPAYQPVSVVPASDTELAQLENIVLNFDATATKVGTTFQGTKIYKGSLVDGKVVGTEVTGYDQWYANVSGSKVTMFPGDEYDGYTMPVKFEKGNEYYVVIPAKSFRNSSSVYNEEIILHYTGSYTEPAFQPTSVVPASDTELAQLENIVLNFDATATKVGTTFQGTKIYKGSLVDGKVVGTEVTGYDQWYANVSGSKVTMFPGDEYDGFTMPVKFEKGNEYYVVIPAKSFRNSSSVYNDEIILHYTGSYTDPTFDPTAISPAQDSKLEQLDNFVMTFDATVTKVGTTFQGTKIYKGSLVNGQVVGTEVTGYDQWYANVSGSKVTMFPGDEYDGFTMPITMMSGTDYYIVIPAKSFRNSSSVYNNEIIIHYAGATEDLSLSPSAISPESETAQTSLCTFELTFPEKVTTVGSTYASTKFMKDNPTSGTELNSHYDQWMCNGSGSTKITLFAADYDGYTCPLTLENDTHYYVVIPAKAFRNSSSAYNSAITLHYTKESQSGVETIETAGNDIVVRTIDGSIYVDADSADVYTLSGSRVAHVEGQATISLPSGLYLVRAQRGDAFKTVKLPL